MLKEYWIRKFKIIENTGGRVKIQWNWPAFLFGGFWLLSKGMWAYSLIYVALVIVYGTFIPPLHQSVLISLFVFNGLYGNYMYYKFKTTKLQLESTIVARLFSMFFFIMSMSYFVTFTTTMESISNYNYRIERLLYVITAFFCLFASMIGIILSNLQNKNWKVSSVNELTEEL